MTSSWAGDYWSTLEGRYRVYESRRGRRLHLQLVDTEDAAVDSRSQPWLRRPNARPVRHAGTVQATIDYR
jgi:hypothetical protein